ncbi:hypothetical protein Hanom_Chr16g01431441 [Helianthus anomalus]
MVVFNYLCPMLRLTMFLFFVFKLNVRLRSFLFVCIRLCSRPVFTELFANN